MEATPLLVIIS